MIAAVTGLIVAITALISTVSVIYFKLRDKVDEVHTLVNQQHDDLVSRLEDMTEQRDAAIKRAEDK